MVKFRDKTSMDHVVRLPPPSTGSGTGTLGPRLVVFGRFKWYGLAGRSMSVMGFANLKSLAVFNFLFLLPIAVQEVSPPPLLQPLYLLLDVILPLRQTLEP